MASKRANWSERVLKFLGVTDVNLLKILAEHGSLIKAQADRRRKESGCLDLGDDNES